MRNTKGITLVALIITIIIMIILAAVSIYAIFESDFIELAINGMEDYEKAQEYEQTVIGNAAHLINKVISGLSGDKDEEEEDEKTIISNKKLLSYNTKDCEKIWKKTGLKDLTMNDNEALLYNTTVTEDKTGIIFNRKHKLCRGSTKRKFPISINSRNGSKYG